MSDDLLRLAPGTNLRITQVTGTQDLRLLHPVTDMHGHPIILVMERDSGWVAATEVMIPWVSILAYEVVP